jgi:diguanylate cyclase (GGDEF)-like protein
LAAVVALMDDLGVERDEGALLRAAVGHVVAAFDISGGVAYVLGDEGGLEEAARQQLVTDTELTLELAQVTLAERRPLVQQVPGGGWLACTPLATPNRQLGALVLHDRGPGEDWLDEQTLEVVGKQVGAALHNAHLYSELRESAARVEKLRLLTATVTSGRDLASVVPPFAEQMRALVAFERLACGFVNETGDYIEMVSHPDGTAWGLGSVLPVVGSGPGFVALNNRPVLQGDLLQEHRFIEDMRLLEEGLRSYMLLPLTSRERAVGVLALGSQRVGAFDDTTLARLQPLADAVALAFDNVRLFQKTREMSISDEVTPLYNFRYFHQVLDRELKLVNRYGSTLALLFIDLDRFKPINDTYGHLRGSRTLREVGFLIRAGVRETDIPARYGGDEFVVILPQTDMAAAKGLGEKLRRLIEGHTFLQEEGIDARLGVSLGVAAYPSEAATKEALIRLADKRMYVDQESRR